MKRDLPDSVVHVPRVKRRILGYSMAWELIGCKNRLALVSSAKISQLVQDAGFTVRGVVAPVFDGGGYTIAVVIAESIVDVHTWPEFDTAIVRTFYCNHSRNNKDKAGRLLRLLHENFDPVDVYAHKVRVMRGS